MNRQEISRPPGHMIPTNESMNQEVLTAEQAARILYNMGFRLTGTPDTRLTDTSNQITLSNIATDRLYAEWADGTNRRTGQIPHMLMVADMPHEYEILTNLVKMTVYDSNSNKHASQLPSEIEHARNHLRGDYDQNNLSPLFQKEAEDGFDIVDRVIAFVDVGGELSNIPTEVRNAFVTELRENIGENYHLIPFKYYNYFSADEEISHLLASMLLFNKQDREDALFMNTSLEEEEPYYYRFDGRQRHVAARQSLETFLNNYTDRYAGLSGEDMLQLILNASIPEEEDQKEYKEKCARIVNFANDIDPKSIIRTHFSEIIEPIAQTKVPNYAKERHHFVTYLKVLYGQNVEQTLDEQGRFILSDGTAIDPPCQIWVPSRQCLYPTGERVDLYQVEFFSQEALQEQVNKCERNITGCRKKKQELDERINYEMDAINRLEELAGSL